MSHLAPPHTRFACPYCTGCFGSGPRRRSATLRGSNNPGVYCPGTVPGRGEARRASGMRRCLQHPRRSTSSTAGKTPLSTLFADLRFALRHLRANPGFTAVQFSRLHLGSARPRRSSAPSILSSSNRCRIQTPRGSLRSGAGVPTADATKEHSAPFERSRSARTHSTPLPRSGHGNRR